MRHSLEATGEASNVSSAKRLGFSATRPLFTKSPTRVFSETDICIFRIFSGDCTGTGLFRPLATYGGQEIAIPLSNYSPALVTMA